MILDFRSLTKDYCISWIFLWFSILQNKPSVLVTKNGSWTERILLMMDPVMFSLYIWYWFAIVNFYNLRKSKKKQWRIKMSDLCQKLTARKVNYSTIFYIVLVLGLTSKFWWIFQWDTFVCVLFKNLSNLTDTHFDGLNRLKFLRIWVRYNCIFSSIFFICFFWYLLVL